MKKYEEISIDVPKYTEQWIKHLREEGLINTEEGRHRAVQWVAETLERADDEFDISLMSLYWAIYRVGNLLLDKYGIELDQYYTKEQSEFLSMIYARLDEKDKYKDKKRLGILPRELSEEVFELIDQLDPPMEEEELPKLTEPSPEEEPELLVEDEPDTSNVITLKPTKRASIIDV